MKLDTKQLHAAAALAACALTGNSANAQATTDTLAGWSVYGDAISQGGAITVTTAFLDGDSDAPHNLSGNSAIDIAALETTAGVAPFALDPSSAQFGTEGSLVGQSFAAVAGQTLTFDWSFGTLECSTWTMPSLSSTARSSRSRRWVHQAPRARASATPSGKQARPRCRSA